MVPLLAVIWVVPVIVYMETIISKMNKFSVLNPQLMRPVKQGASVTGTNNNISIVNVKRFDPYFNCVAAGVGVLTKLRSR